MEQSAPDANGGECPECQSGTYTIRNRPCEPCPANSDSHEAGLAECSCLHGYYRAPLDSVHDHCTS
ncbi:hypothetical protein GBAR_LOCUS19634 [Geodia barretti]|uniref:Uncharacterized protein n=1 Tax=Geodia barretti TaxID=519541 RepID=A0AA35STA5_GEOBA|nr:hypothetical protein GBAR_LOCUS19634 [Geodia barretti]